MTPAFVVLQMYQGQTFDPIVVLNDDAGDPIDLTGKEARMQIREYKGGPIIFELSTANTRIELTVAGEIKFHITAAESAAVLVPGDYTEWVYDLELFYMDGAEEIVDRPIYGVVVFYTEITV